VRVPGPRLGGRLEELLRRASATECGSPYLNGMAYCAVCGKWHRLADAPRARNGAPLCPHCREPLRTKPLKKGTRCWREWLEQRRLCPSRRRG